MMSRPHDCWYDITKIDITKDERQYKENNLKFLKYIRKIVPHIHKKLLKRKNILVCCEKGEQQSANILLCYLIKYGKLSLIDAIKLVKTKRPTIFTPGINFQEALVQFEKDQHI